MSDTERGIACISMSDKSGTCIICLVPYAQLYDHWRKKHMNHVGNKEKFAKMGFVPCPNCHKAFNSQHGVRSHTPRCKAPAPAPVTPTPRPKSNPEPFIARTPLHTEPVIARTPAYVAPQASQQSGTSLNPCTPAWQPSSQDPGPASTPAATPRTAMQGTLKRFLRPPTPPPAHRRKTDAVADSVTVEEIEAMIAQSEREARQETLAPEASRSHSPHSEAPRSDSPRSEPPRAQTPPLQSPSPTPEDLDPEPIPQPRTPDRPIHGDENTPLAQEAAPPAPVGENWRSYKNKNVYLQTLFSYQHIPVYDAPLRPQQAIAFKEAAKRLAIAFSRTPSEKALLDFLLLPKAGLTLGIEQSSIPLKHTLEHFPDSKVSPEAYTKYEKPDGPSHTPADRAIKLLAKGKLGRAARALAQPATLAKNSQETYANLLNKHPQGEALSFASTASPRTSARAGPEHILNALNSFATDTAPGLSGWNVPLLKEAFKSPEVIGMLIKCCNMFITGTLPGKQMLIASRLIAFDKPGGGIRPIAVGDLIYRLIAKAALEIAFDPEMLAPYQLGVRSPGGVEPIVHMLNNVADGTSTKFRNVLSLDFKNAFNTIKRRTLSASLLKHAPDFWKLAQWTYNESAALLLYDGTLIRSTEGVRQGDPLGPFFFSVAIRNTLDALLEGLQNKLGYGTHVALMAYLDDVYIFSDKEIAVSDVAELLHNGPIALNPAKCKASDIYSLRSQGLDALGSHIGQLPSREAFLRRKLEELEGILDLVLTLPRQQALLMLKASTSVLLRHLPRTLVPQGLDQVYCDIDKVILAAVQRLKGPYQLTSPRDRDLMALPERLGGLGIPLYYDTAKPTFTASKTTALAFLEETMPAMTSPIPSQVSSSSSPSVRANELLGNRTARWNIVNPEEPSLPQQTPKTPNQNHSQASRDTEPAKRAYFAALEKINATRLGKVKATLTPAQLLHLEENTKYLARRWMTSLPTSKPLTMDDLDVSTALAMRLFTPLEEEQQVCRDCSQTWSYGHEDSCKAKYHRTTYRHNRIVEALAKAMSQKRGNKVIIEPNAYLAPGPAEIRPDIKISYPGGTLFYDVTVVSLMAKTASTSTEATLTTAEKDKERKYKGLGRGFSPFVLSQGGMMGPKTRSMYKELQEGLTSTGADWLDRFISTTLATFRARAWGRHGLDW